MSLTNNNIYSIFYFGKDEGLQLYRDPIKAIAYYKGYSLDLISGNKSKNPIESLKQELEKVSLKEDKGHRVFHFLYEYGYILNGLYDLVEESDLLAIEIKYSVKEKFSKKKGKKAIDYSLKSIVNFKDYKKRFEIGCEHLLNGDCYQFNLTCPFEYEFKNINLDLIFESFFTSNVVLSAYAHGSFIGPLNKAILSNSPECLFQLKEHGQKYKIWSMPIKGTIPHKNNWKNNWHDLQNSIKDQAELDMITDLVRNDLNKIESPSARVIFKSAPLFVPGIIHQYSLVETELGHFNNLFNLMASLFPGGSITGAPKRRVMEILNKIEKRKRAFYCGSTVLIEDNIFAASINIRTAEFILGSSVLSYQAGGGITLNSNCLDEYNEMHLKVNSFSKILSALKI